MIKYFLFACILCLISCENNEGNPRDMVVEDLPFHEAKTPKEYSDLILRAIRTNRDKVIGQELSINHVEFDSQKLNQMISKYSSGIGGREDWQYYDLFEFNESEDQSKGFDYIWMDPDGRIGIHLFILPEQRNENFYLAKLEFRSRLEIFDSWAFPGGEIEPYKKVRFNW